MATHRAVRTALGVACRLTAVACLAGCDLLLGPSTERVYVLATVNGLPSAEVNLMELIPGGNADLGASCTRRSLETSCLRFSGERARPDPFPIIQRNDDFYKCEPVCLTYPAWDRPLFADSAEFTPPAFTARSPRPRH